MPYCLHMFIVLLEMQNNVLVTTRRSSEELISYFNTVFCKHIFPNN